MSSMGFLGAMAGLGQGMQHYSTLLGEKRKKDWEEQAQIAKDQRYQNLLKHQNDWAAKREEDRDTRTHESRIGVLDATVDANVRQSGLVADQGFEKSLAQKNDPRYRELEDREYKTNLERKESELRLGKTIDLEFLEKQAAIASRLSKEEKAGTWQEMEENGYLEGLSPSDQEDLKMAHFYPGLFAALKDENLGSEVNSKLISLYDTTYNNSLGLFKELPTDKKKAVVSASGDRDPDEFYADMLATQAVDSAKNAIKPDTKSNRNNTKELNRIVNAVANGKTTLIDLREQGVAEDVLEVIAKKAQVQYEPPDVAANAETTIDSPSLADQRRAEAIAKQRQLMGAGEDVPIRNSVMGFLRGGPKSFNYSGLE